MKRNGIKKGMGLLADARRVYNECMKHYICTGGCKGVSEKPGVCQATDCPKHGQPLEECNCEDGSHERHGSN